MKHTLPVLAITLLTGAGAFGFISCASNELKGPEPPVTSLKSEPVSDKATNNIPAVYTAPSVPLHNEEASAAVMAAPVVSQPAVSRPAASTAPVAQPLSEAESSVWPWLIFVLALLVLLAQRLRHRRQEAVTAQQPLLAHGGVAAPEAELTSATPAASSAGWIKMEPFFPKPLVPLHKIIKSAAELGILPVIKARAFLRKKNIRLKPLLLLEAKPHPAAREITVTAFFDGREHKMHFSPNTTVKKVTAWAAYQCEIFDLDTRGVYVAIHGYSAPLSVTAHIARFIPREQHHLELDVLTFARVSNTAVNRLD